MKSIRASLTCVLALTVLPTHSCWLTDLFTSTPYNSYNHITPVTYVAPTGYGSGPPSAIMYASVNNGSFGSQEDIYNAMGGSGYENSVYSMYTYVAGGYSFSDAYYQFYDEGYTCNGGKDCKTQGVADIWNAISSDKVVAVQFGGNVGIVRANGATRQCHSIGGNYFACQPSVDFFLMHLPVTGGGSNYYVTVPDFRYNWTGEAVFPSSSYVSAVSNGDWSDYWWVRTTYYGDPDPPEPNHYFDVYSETDPGGDDLPYPYLPVALAPLVSHPEVFPRLEDGPSTTPQDLWKTFHKVPAPQPTTSKEVLDDLVAGLKRTRLSRQPGLESLLLTDGKVSVSGITPVRSLGPAPGYFVVDFVERKSGRLYAQAAISSDGLIEAVRLVPSSEAVASVTSSEQAESILKSLGVELMSRPTLAYAAGSAVTTQFRPFYQATTAEGEQVIVTAQGKAFALGSSPTDLKTKPVLHVKTGPVELKELTSALQQVRR